MIVRTLKRRLNENAGCEMGNIVYTVEDKFQNAFLTSNYGNFNRKIDLAIRSVNASSERDTTSVLANLERDEHQKFTGVFENVSEKNTTPHVFNTYDETRNESLDKVSGLLLAGKHFGWKPHTSGPVRRKLIHEMCDDTQLLLF